MVGRKSCSPASGKGIIWCCKKMCVTMS
jgi:hypothetical protein